MNLEQKLDWKIRKLELATESEPHNPELQLTLAEAYFQKGYYLGKGARWFDKTIDRISQVVENGQANSAACTLLANAFYGKKAYDSAGEAYRRSLELDPKNALAIVGLGNLEKRRGDFKKARECFQRASEFEPGLWQAHYNLGGAYYQEAKSLGLQKTRTHLEKAIYHLVRALELNPFENFVGNIYKDLGELFLHTQQYPHARKCFTRLSRHERYSAIAHYYLGLTYYALGKYNLAIQNYRNFLKHEPGNALAHSKIGLAHLELMNYDKAREACHKALELEPKNVLALFTIGCSHLDELNVRAAHETFEEVLNFAPDYFPAYVELVKTHHYAKDFDWLFHQLRIEIEAFEKCGGYDGGRSYYQGNRGAHRRRVDVLLAQLRAAGDRPFVTMRDLVHHVRTDSLKFQLWEELVRMGREAKIEDVARQLREPELHFSKALGKTVLLLSPHLSEDTLMKAFRAEEDGLKRAALKRLEVKDDIGAYKEALERTRADYSEFQGYILRALALKGTPEAETFLVEALNSSERTIRLSAAVALVNYGNDQAIEILEQESVELSEDERDRIAKLVRVGKDRHAELNKVIRLTDLYHRDRKASKSPRTADRRPQYLPAHCALCARGQREVPRMLAGSRLMICTDCIQRLWKDRAIHRAKVEDDVYCSFCRRSVFEVDAFYTREEVHICNLCLDLGMSVLEREVVEHYIHEL